jgi:hypothetical protein
MADSTKSRPLNIRRLGLDVDKPAARPSVVELAEAIVAVQGVEALHITVTEIDLETVGMDVAIEGANLDHEQILRAIEATGAVVHSIDELVAGARLISRAERRR